MTTYFTEGQQVEATQTCQGMTAGERFTVSMVTARHYAFGTFVTYTFRRENGEEVTVNNAQMVARAA